MIELTKSELVINISGESEEVVSKFLMVYLANQRLTIRQLEVTAALVSRYAVYVSEGVKEPYASQLLFSTEARKAVCEVLGLGSAHLVNTFGQLCEKQILVRENNQYMINPELVPNSTLLFKFKIHDKPRPIRDRSSEALEYTKKRSTKNNAKPVRDGEGSDKGKEHADISVHTKSSTIHTSG